VLSACDSSSSSPGVSENPLSDGTVEPSVTPADPQPVTAENTPISNPLEVTPFLYQESVVEPAITDADLAMLGVDFNIAYSRLGEKVIDQVTEIYTTIDSGLPSSTLEQELLADMELYEDLQNRCGIEFDADGRVTVINCSGPWTGALLFRHPTYENLFIALRKYFADYDGRGSNLVGFRFFQERADLVGRYDALDVRVNKRYAEDGSLTITAERVDLDPPGLACEVQIEPYLFEELNRNECGAALRESIEFFNRLL